MAKTEGRRGVVLADLMREQEQKKAKNGTKAKPTEQADVKPTPDAEARRRSSRRRSACSPTSSLLEP